jgi:hypothetical protein
MVLSTTLASSVSGVPHFLQKENSLRVWQTGQTIPPRGEPQSGQYASFSSKWEPQKEQTFSAM